MIKTYKMWAIMEKDGNLVADRAPILWQRKQEAKDNIFHHTEKVVRVEVTVKEVEK